MKIGIVTIIDNDNYGNRLQNYATCYILNRSNIDTVTFLNEPFNNTKKRHLYRKFRFRNYKGTYSNNKGRADSFKRFNNLINFSKKKLNPFFNFEHCNYYIVGSDQVWNPNFGRLSDVDLLTFVNGKKRISFSASFGVSTLPKAYNNIIKKELKKFKAISIREEAGKKIIEEVCDRKDVHVVLDPTMLLKDSEWYKVSKVPTMLKEGKFILNYFLGNLSNERQKTINEFAQKNGCYIIDILNKNDPFYECGPSEFLYLEKNAFLICTDSFHSSVFAILFDRPFMVFDRDQENVVSMNSRLDTLLSKFNLNSRKYDDNTKNITLDHDYSEVYVILEHERKKTLNFLKKSINVDNIE